MGSLRTFEMNLEEDTRDKKAKGIAFQAKIHTGEMKSACDYDDDDLTEVVVKIFKRLNKSCPRSRNSNDVSTGVPTLRGNIPPNAGNFDASSRNRFNTGNSSESDMKNKEIQCSECEGFGYLQEECANKLKKKNKTFNATWSDGDSDYSNDDESNFVCFCF